jgi:RNA polymerase sigma factor (sigma-70 family)
MAKLLCARTSAFAAMPALDWEDIAQEATARVLTVGVEQYDGRGSARGFLYRVVKTTLLMALRASGRREHRERSYVEAQEPHQGASPHARIDVEALLGRLDVACRELVAAMFLDGVTVRAFARAKRVEESTVRSRMSRCLRRARELSR